MAWKKYRVTSWSRSSVATLLSWIAVASTIPPATTSPSDEWVDSPLQVPLLAPHASSYEPRPERNTNGQHEFSLRHVFHHGTYEYPNVHVRLNVPAPEESPPRTTAGNHQKRSLKSSLKALSKSTPIERLSDRRVKTVRSMYHAARRRGSPARLDSSAWRIDDVSGPDILDKDTVLSLANMSWNAYQNAPGEGEWQDMGGDRFNFSQSFGWEGDGIRGHIFADKDNSTIVMSLKGTSPAVFDGAETTTNDKVNDNLFFSCCCGQGGQYLWHQVCDCMTSAYTCNQTCVVTALKEENRYYAAALELYGNATALYPDSNIWLVGHSLGGAISALLGLTFGVPVTTFEAPGDALASARLGLPYPPGSHVGAPQTRKYTGAVHFGHTADPIFMGSCNAATSGCTLGGYAMQTQCHTGQVCIYDTVGDKQWRVGISYHKIKSVIHDVIEAYDELPSCKVDEECVDCFNWKYFESNGSDTTRSTSSPSSTTTMTRTSTCQTPGWWGCLDSTTTESTTPSTTEVPLTSCVKFGWFGGCLETVTVTPTSSASNTKTAPNILTTTSCESYWLGDCIESTTMTLFPTSCAKHGWLGFGPCISTTTFYPPATAAPAAVPTITTTRPLPTAPKPTS
ncbi:uncharacterized protein KY384_005475 [Bacidia gigantensis]|uniref:uncharacterized protein n=1 Tax=Bacidia gigantensis TaxID=2732470 RepID=UPI001D040817|nr:uncharacterized protein KY384_005475 [Bacidia gigantensis]KAG8529993.1 hypothetical protein KY384_005475 [Bacidia gigantensis]